MNYEYGNLNLGTGQVTAGTNNGNIAKQTITVQNTAQATGFTATQYYAYDSLNRIEIASENLTPNGGTLYNSWKQTFQYDRFGNRRFDTANTTTIPTGCAEAICNPQINTANNRLVGTTYDDAGNATTDASGRTFTYDAENKQTKVQNGTTIIGEYFYDGDGKRIKKIVPSTGEITIFIYDASGKMVAEYSTIVATQSEAKISYLTNDHLDSPRIITDQNGAVVSRRDFMPFGEEISRTNYGNDNVREKFATYERDAETQLDFAQARMYIVVLGRFSMPDMPFVDQNEENPQSWNLYIYVGNNPLLFIDPTGMFLTDFINFDTGERTHVPDGKDQVIAVDGNQDKELLNLFNSNKDSYFQTLKEYEDSALNLDMTTAQFNNLAEVLYAESSSNTSWAEVGAIHGVLRNRAIADGNSVLEQANDTSQVLGGLKEARNRIYTEKAPSKVKAVYQGIVLSIVAFKGGGLDLSQGAYFWQGTDFKGPNKIPLAYEKFYLRGFYFTSPSHNIFNMDNYESTKEPYKYTYESTAAYGQTIFMRITEGWMKASKATRWNGGRR